MKRQIGIALLSLAGLILVPIGSAWAIFVDHMRTIGLSRGAESALVILFVADIICLVAGIYLITTKSKPRTN